MRAAPIEDLAERLREAHALGLPCAPTRDDLPAGDVQQAYAVQELNTRLWLDSGRRKIGLTSSAVQKQLGVDQPDFGTLFAGMAVCDAEQIPSGAVLQAKVEADVAFVPGRDINVAQPTVAHVIRAIHYVTIAIEGIGIRIENRNIHLVDTVADNASSGMFVLGDTPLLNGLDLRDYAMRMTRGADTVSVGVGHQCLGHPLNATLWLARKMVEVGRPLMAGDVILSGALGPMVAANQGDVFEAPVTGLGTVRAAFALA